MFLIKNNSTDPHFNMAVEEYLLNCDDLPIITFWQNANTVVIGKNQNAYEQLNLDYVNENGIKVVRRLSGGGAVFHDVGNINYTFIAKSEGGLDFEYFCRPVIEALETLGVKCHLSGRNDIVTDDGNLKFSGTAQCTYVSNGVKKILHHGTLLYSADMTLLAGALNVDEEKMRSKGIKSVKSRVTNIAPLVNKKMTASEFKEYLEAHFAKKYSAIEKTFNESDIIAINKLKEEKYATEKWIFGEKTVATKMQKHRFDFGIVQISLTLEKAHMCNEKIAEISIYGDFFGEKDTNEITKRLCGIDFSEVEIRRALDGVNISEYIFGATADDLLYVIFKREKTEE